MPGLADLPKYLVIAVLVGGAVVLVGQLTATDNSKTIARLNVPAFSSTAIRGQKLFNENCAACHGNNAAGSSSGPPLVHRLYVPNHHNENAFQAAVQRGVRAHHWNFGNMPPQPQVSQSDVTLIVRYIREMQRANGLF